MEGLGERWARDEKGRPYKVPADMSYKEWKKKFVGESNILDKALSGDLQDRIKKSMDSFVPAKTIEEAEEFASRFIGDGYSPKFKNKAIFKGISLECANEINRTLYALYENIDMPKLNGIKVISATSALGKKIFKSGADAIAAYNPAEKGIFINKDVLKSIKAFEDYNKRAIEAWDTVMGNLDKLTGSDNELALTYKNAGRSLVDDSIHGAILHEMGHHVQWQVLDVETNNAVGRRMKEYAPMISGYANANKSEYLAESFVAYIKGETGILDKAYVDFLDRMYKVNIDVKSVARANGGKVFAKGTLSGIIETKAKDLQKYIGEDIIQTDNQSIREWYVANVSDIPNQIDRTKPFEEQVRQAYELRNKYKREARIAMSDVETAKELEELYPVMSFEDLLKSKMNKKNMSKEEALKDILKTASETNKSVNREFGI